MKEYITADSRIILETDDPKELSLFSYDVMVGCADKRNFKEIIKHASLYGTSILALDLSSLATVLGLVPSPIEYNQLTLSGTARVFVFKVPKELVSKNIENDSLKQLEKIKNWIATKDLPEPICRSVLNSSYLMMLSRRIMKEIVHPRVKWHLRVVGTLPDFLVYSIDQDYNPPRERLILIDYYPDTDGFLSLAPTQHIKDDINKMLTMLCYPPYHRDIQINDHLLFRISYFENRYYVLPLNVFEKVNDKFILTPLVERNIHHPIVKFARHRYYISDDHLSEKVKALHVQMGGKNQ